MENSINFDKTVIEFHYKSAPNQIIVEFMWKEMLKKSIKNSVQFQQNVQSSLLHFDLGSLRKLWNAQMCFIFEGKFPNDAISVYSESDQTWFNQANYCYKTMDGRFNVNFPSYIFSRVSHC